MSGLNGHLCSQQEARTNRKHMSGLNGYCETQSEVHMHTRVMQRRQLSNKLFESQQQA
jgi:hypothetical protein